eukprot:COSAG05_NODE_20164_length_282_cov_0.841530_1_plen_22_part_10
MLLCLSPHSTHDQSFKQGWTSL